MAGLDERIIDTIDLETFLLSETEEEARQNMKAIMEQHGFDDIDIVFAEKHGMGTRIRARAYIYRPGVKYDWLKEPGLI